MPPTPSIGRMATASTMMPMPPSQLSKWRHRLMERGRNSSPESTVPPVVVKPDAASKYASVKLMGRKCQSGKPATAGSATQVSATSIRPSRVLSSRLKRRVASHSSRAEHESRQCGNDEGPESRIERPHGQHQRRQHGHGEHHHDEGKDVRDRQ